MENILFSKVKVNVSFENLCYTVPVARRNEKEILKNLNGYFKSENISAILGPSGGGKTTLLNILSGFTIIGTSGTININGEKRNLHKFHKISRYIMDKSTVTSGLTVDESMYFASRFKLGNRISFDESTKMIEESLKTLRLSDCKKTLTNNLSNGEKKRLVIALELLGCPSIIFLDEPTTGLDEQNSFECISLLRNLAEQGITVILSIHTPSAKVLEQFHQIYVMAEGQCVYKGSGSELIPYFNKIMLDCPIHYNPIDFLIELASGDYGNYTKKLVDLASNDTRRILDEPSKVLVIKSNTNLMLDENYNSSVWTQFFTLIHRAYLQGKNDIANLFIRMISMTFIVLTIATTYYNCGNDGTKIMSNITFLIMTNFNAIYFIMIPVLSSVPMQMKIIRSEYFNKWYNVLPYFLSQSVQKLLYTICCAAMYVAIVYPITGQPLDIIRMFQFFLIYVLVCMITEAICEIVGAILNPVNSLFLGVTIIMPWALFSFVGMGHEINLLPEIYQYIIKISYVRIGVVGFANTVYNNRNRIYCPEDELICPLSTADQVLKQFGYEHSTYMNCILYLIIWFIVMKVLAFFVLRERLNPNVVTNKIYMIVNYAKVLFAQVDDK